MSLPSEKTLKKWKEEFGWLRITENQKMICTICCSQEEIQHSEAVAAGISLPPRQVEQHILPNPDIVTDLQQVDEKDRNTVEKLHEISFNIAFQGLSFTALTSKVERFTE